MCLRFGAGFLRTWLLTSERNHLRRLLVCRCVLEGHRRACFGIDVGPHKRGQQSTLPASRLRRESPRRGWSACGRCSKTAAHRQNKLSWPPALLRLCWCFAHCKRVGSTNAAG
ncbi:unnamed protein product [Amoebophrya sp. A25]|nr:unnamed protein product [Amoebophrya sp. A25]|eukprot:GSA25T00000443001.1